MVSQPERIVTYIVFSLPKETVEKPSSGTIYYQTDVDVEHYAELLVAWFSWTIGNMYGVPAIVIVPLDVHGDELASYAINLGSYTMLGSSVDRPFGRKIRIKLQYGGSSMNDAPYEAIFSVSIEGR